MNELFIRSVTMDWSMLKEDEYLLQIPALKKLEKLSFLNNVTFFVGENGSGKSTLLEALAVHYGFNAEGGTKNYNFSTYDSHSSLYKILKVTKGVIQPRHSYFLRAESFYNVASKAEGYRMEDPTSKEVFYSRNGGKSFHEQSHGESFFSIVKGEFQPFGLFLLDEPEAALSISKQLALLVELEYYAKKGAQFIIATHSPILLGLPGATILSFSDKGIKEVEYEDTISFELTELFINHREAFLNKLLAERENVGE